jgi:hypothetical protein
MTEFMYPPVRCTCPPSPCPACADYTQRPALARAVHRGRTHPAILLQYHREKLAEEQATFTRLSQVIAARRQRLGTISPVLRAEREAVRTSLLRRKRRIAALQAGSPHARRSSGARRARTNDTHTEGTTL